MRKLSKMSMIFTGGPSFVDDPQYAKKQQEEERQKRQAALNNNTKHKSSKSSFLCCTTDNTVRRDLNMTEISRVEPFQVEEIPLQLYHNSLQSIDMPKTRMTDAEAMIEARVSERLNQELNLINQHKDKQYQMQMQQERQMHEQKQQELKQKILLQDRELEKKNKMLRAQQRQPPTQSTQHSITFILDSINQSNDGIPYELPARKNKPNEHSQLNVTDPSFLNDQSQSPFNQQNNHGFWTQANIARFTQHLKIRQTASREPHNRKMVEDFYNQVSAEMDVKRDMAYQELNEDFLGGNPNDYSRILQSMSQHELQEYNAKKQEVRWECAWELFDAINQRQGLDNKFEIDLNELDIEEAQAICKQIIYDIAENAKTANKSHKIGQEHVLAILCADTHFEWRADADNTYSDVSNNMTTEGQRYPVNAILEMIGRELKLDHHYIHNCQTILVRINANTYDNSVLADW